MITKFKLFEINLIDFNENKFFFKVSSPITKYKLKNILFKLNYNWKHNDLFIDGVINVINNFDNLYLSFYRNMIVDTFKIGYMIGDEHGYDFYIKNGFLYCGEIELTEDDIEKYEIYLNSKKYNL